MIKIYGKRPRPEEGVIMYPSSFGLHV